MRKMVFVMAVLWVALIVSSAFAVEVEFDNYMAGARYKENDSAFFNGGAQTIGSYWTGFLYKGTLALTDYDNKNIEGEIRYGMPLTQKSREKWDFNDVEVQTNDMSFWGVDTGLAAGWAFPFTFAENKRLTLTPLAGYTWRFIRFSRSNYTISTIFGPINIAETTDEDYNIHTIDIGGRFSFQFEDSDKFDFYAKPMFGIVLYDSAHNSDLGTVEGDGGLISTIDIGMDYSITKNLILGLMFRAEHQSLEGGMQNNLIWPDNTLETLGGTVSLKYRF